MYGTIGRFHIKPGMEAQFRQLIESQGRPFETWQVPGFVASYAYRMDADPNEYYLAAVFSSKEAYWANAQNPEQEARYRQWLPLLEGEPECALPQQNLTRWLLNRERPGYAEGASCGN